MLHQIFGNATFKFVYVYETDELGCLKYLSIYWI